MGYPINHVGGQKFRRAAPVANWSPRKGGKFPNAAALGIVREKAHSVTKQRQPFAFGRQTPARPTRMLRGQDVALGMRHQAEDAARGVAQAGHIAL